MAFTDLNENKDTPGIESWSFRSVARDYRKVAIIGLLAGLIAFMGSMIVPPTYASGTRVLLRGRDSTLLASSGESLGSSGGALLDSQLAAALTETQAGLLNTRTVAVEIVDRLDLDAPVDNSGFVGTLKVIGVETYLRSRAYITHGFYKEIPHRERVIGQVQGDLGAEQVEDSYVLEIVGVWDEPEAAAAIANAAADIMVEQSISRSAGESTTYRDFLSQQVVVARAQEQAARIAVAEFQSENEILNIDELLSLSSRSVQTLDDEIDRSRADVDSLQARVSNLERSLAETTPTTDRTEQITTGRSTTSIDSTSANPTFTALSTELEQTKAQQAGAEARLAALESARAGAIEGSTGDLSDQEAELRILLLDQRIAEESLEELNGALRVATINAERPQVEVLRLDEAAVPIYPIGPKRYLYLGIGMFIGGLAGFLWSYLGVRRREAAGGLEVDLEETDPTPDGDGSALDEPEVEIVLEDEPTQTRELVGAGANGSGANGAGSSARARNGATRNRTARNGTAAARKSSASNGQAKRSKQSQSKSASKTQGRQKASTKQTTRTVDEKPIRVSTKAVPGR
jgi:uncharacterized protein involved in exopolysaccharide biosynthesis